MKMMKLALTTTLMTGAVLGAFIESANAYLLGRKYSQSSLTPDISFELYSKTSDGQPINFTSTSENSGFFTGAIKNFWYIDDCTLKLKATNCKALGIPKTYNFDNPFPFVEANINFNFNGNFLTQLKGDYVTYTMVSTEDFNLSIKYCKNDNTPCIIGDDSTVDLSRRISADTSVYTIKQNVGMYDEATKQKYLKDLDFILENLGKNAIEDGSFDMSTLGFQPILPPFFDPECEPEEGGCELNEILVDSIEGSIPSVSEPTTWVGLLFMAALSLKGLSKNKSK